MGHGHVAAEHHVTGDGDLVGFVSVAGVGSVVCAEAPFAAGVANRDLHDDAHAGVFGVSGERGYGLPAAIAVARVLLHFCGGWGSVVEGARRRQAAATTTRQTGARRAAS